MALNPQELEKLKILLSAKEEGDNIKSGTKDFLQKSLPIAGMVVGGLGGGILGGPPGAITGSAVGGALGEAGAEKLGGEELHPSKIITSGLEAGVSEVAGFGLTKIGGAIAKPILSKGKAILKFAGKKLEPLLDVAKAGLRGIKKVLPGISDDTAKTIASKAD